MHSVGAGARAELVWYEGVRGPGGREQAPREPLPPLREVTVRVLGEEHLVKAVGAVTMLDGEEGRGWGLRLDQLTSGSGGRGCAIGVVG